MLDAEWTTERVGDATLVEVQVENGTAVSRRVRVENLLDGPALPPGREGVAEAGWDDDGYTGVVPPNDALAVGYACPAAPAEPPVRVSDEGRATEAASTGSDESAGDAPTAADAVRLLGDPSPPRDVLPAGRPVADGGETWTPGADPPDPDAVESDGSEERGAPAGGAEEPTASGGGAEASGDSEAIAAPAGDEGPLAGSSGAAPDAPADDTATDWLDAVERRVVAGERLTEPTVAEAAAVLEDRGGVEGAATLADRLDADAAALRAHAERAAALAERIERVDVPLDALRRLS